MSIPDRLWRVVRGHWTMISDDMVGERTDAVSAEADAWQELAEVLRRPQHAAAAQGTQPASLYPGAGALPVESGSGTEAHPVEPDTLRACYELLGVGSQATLPEVDEALDARLDTIHPERYAAGSPERRALEARRSALQAAYERVRDELNPTESRFERLELE